MLEYIMYKKCVKALTKGSTIIQTSVLISGLSRVQSLAGSKSMRAIKVVFALLDHSGEIARKMVSKKCTTYCNSLLKNCREVVIYPARNESDLMALNQSSR